MTVAKFWDGTAWASAARGPTGASGVGDLLAVQREWGRNNAYVAHNTNGMAVYCDAAYTIPLQVRYTPTVDCWWCVSATIGLISKVDAAYHNLMGYLQLDPADFDGQIHSFQYEYQHLQVQTYAFRQLQRTWGLSAGVAYSCTARVSMGAGNWSIYQGPAHLAMQGAVYRR